MSIMKTRSGGNALGLPAVWPETELPAPVPLPSLPTAFSRRAALFGAVTATGFLGTAATAALGQGMGITPIPSALDPADARLVELAALYEDLDRQCDAHNEAYRGRVSKTSEAAFDAITSQFGPVEDEVAETPADTMVGILAKARMCQSRSMRDMCVPEVGLSIADDLHRLHNEGRLS